jgi:maltose O-acetyltransferase
MRRVLRAEWGAFPPGLWLAGLLMRGWPPGAGMRLRTRVYRLAGLRLGPGTLIAGPLDFGMTGDPRRNLRVGARCFVNSHVFVDAAAPVTLGDGVSVGHHTVFVTSGHAVGGPGFRAGDVRADPITVGDGAWIAAGVTLLPGVTVGAGAVVAAGAVVTRDVPPHTLAGGIPARTLRALSEDETPPYDATDP